MRKNPVPMKQLVSIAIIGCFFVFFTPKTTKAQLFLKAFTENSVSTTGTDLSRSEPLNNKEVNSDINNRIDAYHSIVSPQAAPTNDLCASAKLITTASTCIAGTSSLTGETVASATATSTTSTCGGTVKYDVW